MHPPVARALAVSLLAFQGVAVAETPPASAPSSGEALHDRCRREFQLGSYERAIDTCKQAYLTEAQPDPAILFTIAQAYNNLDQPGQAGRFYRQFLAAVGPSYPARSREQVEGLIADVDARAAAAVSASLPSLPPAATAPAPRLAPRGQPPGPPPGSRGHDWLSIGLLSAGGASIIAGSLLVSTSFSELHGAPAQATLDGYYGAQSTARLEDRVGLGLGVAGLALVTAGVVHYALPGAGDRGSGVTLAVGPSGMSLSERF